MVRGLPDSCVKGSWERVPPVNDADHARGADQSVACHRTAASGADEELLWLLALADPVYLDDYHAFAADVGQVDEHQRASLDGAQPRRLACELPPVEEDHRFADGQFLGYLTDRCQGGR